MLGLRDEHLDADALAELASKTAISDHLVDLAATNLEERETTFGEETWALVERAVLLRAIDTLWVDHLTELEDFRRGVGLRGYGGTDPLVEFKREAFKLYDELRGFIRHQVAATIFRVSVQRRTAAPAEPAEMPTLTPEQLAKLKAGAAAGGAWAPAAAAIASGGSVTSSSGAFASAELAPLPPSGQAAAAHAPAARRGDRRRPRPRQGPRRSPRTSLTSVATTPAGAGQARSSSAATAPEAAPPVGSSQKPLA